MTILSPGKSNSLGLPGILGGTTHELTIDDAIALGKLPEIEAVAPLAFAPGTGRRRRQKAFRSSA